MFGSFQGPACIYVHCAWSVDTPSISCTPRYKCTGTPQRNTSTSTCSSRYCRNPNKYHYHAEVSVEMPSTISRKSTWAVILKSTPVKILYDSSSHFMSLFHFQAAILPMLILQLLNDAGLRTSCLLRPSTVITTIRAIIGSARFAQSRILVKSLRPECETPVSMSIYMPLVHLDTT